MAQTPAPLKKEPYYTILAFEKLELQKPLEMITSTILSEKAGAQSYEVWRQNPLSIMPNVLAWASMTCYGGFRNRVSPKFEEHFDLDFSFYPRTQKRMENGSILEQHLFERCSKDPDAARTKDIVIQLRERDDHMKYDATRFTHDIQDLLPDALKDVKQNLGFAPYVPGTIDAFTHAFRNENFDVATAKTCEKGLFRRGIDIVAVNLLYNRGFIETLCDTRRGNKGELTYQGIKDAKWVLFFPEDMYERDLKTIDGVKGDYAQLDPIQKMIAMNVALPIIAFKTKTGLFTPVGAQDKKGSRIVPRSSETQVLRKIYTRIPSVAFDSAILIDKHIIEKNRTHPWTINEYERQKTEVDPEEKIPTGPQETIEVKHDNRPTELESPPVVLPVNPPALPKLPKFSVRGPRKTAHLPFEDIK
jgi:hypothetical protein